MKDRRLLLRSLWLWLLLAMALALFPSCQKLPRPVCQKCEKDAHCHDGEVCYKEFMRCIPRGSCYCPPGLETCKSALCQAQGGRCHHPPQQLAGACRPPVPCQDDVQCSFGELCYRSGQGETGSCLATIQCIVGGHECSNEGQIRACNTTSLGRCRIGEQICRNGTWQRCEQTKDPLKEVCNEIDDNCDGAVDEGLSCVVIFAGSRRAGFEDGDGQEASFRSPRGVAVDARGNVYVADYNNHAIRKIDPKGKVTTFAGSGVAGHKDGEGRQAQFNEPHNLVTDGDGNVYVADTANHAIRKIDGQGKVTTFAGSGVAGHKDGEGRQAQFNFPRGLALAPDGALFVADTDNHCIRKILKDGTVTTLAGTGTPGYHDGAFAQASFRNPHDVAFDPRQVLYVADTGNHVIRALDLERKEASLAAGKVGVSGSANGGKDEARFKSPAGLFFLRDLLLIADRDNHMLRSLNRFGGVSLLAGAGVSGLRNGEASQALFHFPWAVTSTFSGQIFIADTDNNVIRSLVIHP